MPKKALVLFAPGFEEIEALTPVDVLRRAGVDVTTAGIGGIAVTGVHDITVRADTTIEHAVTGDYDLLVIPGGMPGAKNIGENPLARELAARLLAEGKLVAAICAGPVQTLGAWGMLAGKRATCHPSQAAGFPADVRQSTERVVEDGRITTSQGPGTAMEFALALAARLTDAKTAAEVAAGMLAK